MAKTIIRKTKGEGQKKVKKQPTHMNQEKKRGKKLVPLMVKVMSPACLLMSPRCKL